MALSIRDFRGLADDVSETGAYGKAPPSYDTVIVIEFGDDGSEFLDVRLPHNPESYETEYRARWKARQAPGTERDLSDFDGFDPMTRSFEWMGETDNPLSFESNVLIPLEAAMETINAQSQEAPRVQFIQGIHSMRGHIDSLSITRVRTDHAGYARVARISMRLTQNDD